MCSVHSQSCLKTDSFRELKLDTAWRGQNEVLDLEPRVYDFYFKEKNRPKAERQAAENAEIQRANYQHSGILHSGKKYQKPPLAGCFHWVTMILLLLRRERCELFLILSWKMATYTGKVFSYICHCHRAVDIFNLTLCHWLQNRNVHPSNSRTSLFLLLQLSSTTSSLG